VTGDPLFPFVEKFGLTGCLVEPQADAFARLEANYSRFEDSSFTFVRAAIGEADGIAGLYHARPMPQDPEWLPRVASFDHDLFKTLAHVIPNLDSRVETESVPCITFETLFRDYGLPHVDLLQIDAEGYDAELLRLFDIPKRMPAIVQFEHKHLEIADHNRCLDDLRSLGYELTFSSDDTFAFLA